MTRTVFFLDRAIDDIQYAFDWYELQQESLGTRFKKAVEEVAIEISKFPFAFPNKHKVSGETIIPKFPYVIIDRFDKTTIYIQAVFPARMNPTKKY